MFFTPHGSGDLASLSATSNNLTNLLGPHGLSSQPSFGDNLLKNASMLATRAFTSFIDVQGRMTRNQKVATQLTTCILSGCSLLCSLVALYWFWRMKRLFRHKLIMMLVFADIGRSFWYFVFTSVALAGNSVNTSTGFCQASGFLIQVAIEGADMAVLIIAVHTAIQVFRPTPFGSRPGGLYPCRYPVYAAAILYPLTMSSLAFIQGRHAFFYQGLPVCNLPIRPFWYRLAISWIPRYIIFLVTLGIAIAIYIRADFGSEINQFYDRRFSAFGRRGTALSVPPVPQAPSLVFLTDANQDDQTKPEAFASDSIPLPGRKMSGGTTLVGSHASVRSSSDTSAANHKSSRWTSQASEIEHLSPSRITSPIFEEGQPHHSDITKPGPGKSSREPSEQHEPPSIITKSRRPQFFSGRHRSSESRPFGFNETRVRRETARRQLRLMFVYPIVYFFIWLVPFINHLTQYSNEFAQHPVFALTILTWISIASMGMVDAFVFSIREKPWKHIPGSDGTFFGSFRFWKHAAGSEKNPDSLSTTDHEAFVPARRTTSIWAWLRRNTFPSSQTTAEVDHHETARTRQSSLAISDTHTPAVSAKGRTTTLSAFAGSAGPAGATLDTMHSWGFAQASNSSTDRIQLPARPQEAYWFDRPLGLALGRTGLEEVEAEEGLGRVGRGANGHGVRPLTSLDDD